MDEWDDEDHSPALGQAEFIVAKRWWPKFY